LTSNGCSSRGLITGNHDNFNACRSAFKNGIRHTGFRGIDQRNKTTERKTSEFEVEVGRACDIENSLVKRVFFSKQMKLCETKNSLTFLAETKIYLIKFSMPIFIDFWSTIANKDVRAVFPDSLRGSFHVYAIVTVIRFLLDDCECEFHCRVERHSCKLA